MPLTGIEIFKLLPKTNCGECGVPTCLAFAMNLAAGKAELSACPYVSEEARAKLEEASAPPIKPVTIGVYNTCQRKFILGDGGLLRMVWMPKMLKEEIADRLKARAEEMGVPNLPDMIADETIGSTEEEILPFLQEKGHPALTMEPILG